MHWTKIYMLKTIARLFKNYKPLNFFGIIAFILFVLALIFFIPVLYAYIQTGLVKNFPTLIVCGFTVIAAILSLFSGLQLQTIAQKNRQDFEMELIRCHNQFKDIK